MGLFSCLKQTVYFVLPPLPVVEQAFSLKKLYNQRSYKQMAFKGVCMLSGTAIGLGWSLANANNMFNFFYEVGTGVDDATAIVDKSPNAKAAAGTATTITVIWLTATGTRIGGLVADGVMAMSNRLYECVRWPNFSWNANHHSQEVNRQENSQNLPLETIAANSAKQEESKDESKYYSVDNETEESINYVEQSKNGIQIDENALSISMPSAPASQLFGLRNPRQISKLNNANQSEQVQSQSPNVGDNLKMNK